MEFTLEEKIRAIYNSGNVVKIGTVIRTKNGGTYYKYVWDVDGTTSKNWFGFDTLDECVEDCITHLTINSKWLLTRFESYPDYKKPST